MTLLEYKCIFLSDSWLLASLLLWLCIWAQQTSCKVVLVPVLWVRPVVHIHCVNSRFVKEEGGSLKSYIFCEAVPDEGLSWDSLPCRGHEPNFHSSLEPTSLPTRQAQVTERTHSKMERMEKERRTINDGISWWKNCGQRGRKWDRLCGRMKQK